LPEPPRLPNRNGFYLDGGIPLVQISGVDRLHEVEVYDEDGKQLFDRPAAELEAEPNVRERHGVPAPRPEWDRVAAGQPVYVPPHSIWPGTYGDRMGDGVPSAFWIATRSHRLQRDELVSFDLEVVDVEPPSVIEGDEMDVSEGNA
jgi:hypothetical protein